MPEKRVRMKRKLNTSQTRPEQDTIVPAKVIKKKLSLGTVAKRLVDRAPGQVLTMGQGDVGQLGLGPDKLECSRPAKVQSLSDIVHICAGGMHSVCLNSQGKVITFGCNDEGALGRETCTEGSETLPGEVKLDGKVVQISAGDSHSAALLEDGRVFVWGAFRDSHGTMGLTIDTPQSKGLEKPTLVAAVTKVTMISSGNDHLLLLTQHGQLYSCGSGEQGQLGRLPERGATRLSRKGLDQLLIPSLVQFSRVRLEIEKIWSGAFSSFIRDKSGKVYVFGLNNYKQLGLDNMKTHFYPSLSETLSEIKCVKICADQHHTLALDSQGVVHALGRKEYGRLGLGPLEASEVGSPTPVPALKSKKCVDIGCGTSCSFAVTEEGELYSWGMGSSSQLGTGDDDDRWEPTLVKGKQLEGSSVVAVAGGGQHTMILTQVKDSMDLS